MTGLIRYTYTYRYIWQNISPKKEQKDCLEEGVATPSNILAWRIPWTNELARLYSTGSHTVRHNWNDLACVHALLFAAMCMDLENIMLHEMSDKWCISHVQNLKTNINECKANRLIENKLVTKGERKGEKDK